MSSDRPLYTSKSTVRSLWQRYHVFRDHIRLDTHFGALEIPFDQIERLDVRPSDLGELIAHGDLQLRGFRPALKVDWANFVEHVVLDKSEGWMRRVLFTPEDPEGFRSAYEAAYERWRVAEER